MAEAERRSLSNMVLVLVEEGIKRRAEGKKETPKDLRPTANSGSGVIQKPDPTGGNAQTPACRWVRGLSKTHR